MTYQSGHKTIFWLPYTPTNFANLSTVSVVMMVMMNPSKFTRSANSAGSNKDMIWLILPSTLWTNYITKSSIPVRKSKWCNSYHSPDPLLPARTRKGNDLQVKTAFAISTVLLTKLGDLRPSNANCHSWQIPTAFHHWCSVKPYICDKVPINPGSASGSW